MKSLKLIAFIMAFVLIIAGCGRKEEVKKTEKKDTVSVTKRDSVEAPKPIELNTKSGKKFDIIVKKSSASLSDIFVVGKGFENSKDTISFKDADMYENVMLGDLDGDGFEELYIVTRSQGSGSYAKIFGIASFGDKSYGQINIPEIAESDMKAGKYFEGYMGFDEISLAKDKLVREFPVYKEKDINANPTGGKRKVLYTLSKGEAAPQLKPTGREDVK